MVLVAVVVVACGLSNGGGGCERMPYVIKNPSARKELTFWPCSQARNPGGLRLRRAISLIDGFTWFGGGVVLTTSRGMMNSAPQSFQRPGWVAMPMAKGIATKTAWWEIEIGESLFFST